jgi:hypothetical protein
MEEGSRRFQNGMKRLSNFTRNGRGNGKIEIV